MTIMIDKNFTLHHRYNMRHRNALAIFFAHHSFRISAVRQPHGQLVPFAAQVHHRAVHLKRQFGQLPDHKTICWTWCAFLPACSPMRKKRISSQWGSSFSFLCCLSSWKILDWLTWSFLSQSQQYQVFTYPSPPSTFHQRHSVGPPSLERFLPERVRLWSICI